MRTAYLKATIIASIALCGAAVIPSCGGSTNKSGTDSNTHWLDVCERDDQCGSLQCICGVCTKTCTADATCAGLGDNAVCAAPDCSQTTETVCVAAPGGGTRDGSASDASAPGVSRACTKSSDCAIAEKSCCSFCTTPTLDDVLAVNVESVTAYRESFCTGESPPCPMCVPAPANPTIHAMCVSGQCEAIDVRAYAGCSADADCSVRTVDCCECGGDLDALIAISDPMGYWSSPACSSTQACDACAPVYPESPRATCDPSLNVCVLDYSSSTPDGGMTAQDAGAFRLEDCSLPADSGPCDAAIQRWYYDASTATCRQFVYGGCEGNLNNFASFLECETNCGARADSCNGCANGCPTDAATDTLADGAVVPSADCSTCPLSEASGGACTQLGMECHYDGCPGGFCTASQAPCGTCLCEDTVNGPMWFCFAAGC